MALNGAVERESSIYSKEARSALLKEVLSEDNELADGKDCPNNVEVHVIEYPPEQLGKKGLRSILDEFRVQAVVPHPAFKMVYHKNSATAVFRRVDLAILVLDRPVVYLSKPIKLARSGVKLKERVAMVGYGFGKIPESQTAENHRVVGDSVIIDIMGRGANEVFYAREELSDGGIPSRIYGGDSGGPCFSKADDSMLVGIATGVAADNGKEESIFTSVFPHRGWISSVAAIAKERVD